MVRKLSEKYTKGAKCRPSGFFFLLLTNLSERGFPRPRGRNGSGTVQPGLFHGEGSKRYNINNSIKFNKFIKM